jgi:hypothetical protein
MDPKKFPELLSIVFVGLSFYFIVFPLDSFSGKIVGHLLGIIGTVLIVATLVYVFRKRILKQKGKANPLNQHSYFGLIGGILVVIHSGGKSASLIGALIFISMLLTVLSGVVGRILFVKLNKSIKEKKSDIEALETSLKTQKKELNPKCWQKEFNFYNDEEWAEETSGAEIDPEMDSQMREKCSNFLLFAESLAEREERLQVYSKTKTLFTFWNSIHIVSTCFLVAMIIVHVMTTLYYGLRWLP